MSGAAEIDRLRAELATWKKAHIELGEMRDRLRDENAQLRAYAQHKGNCSLVVVQGKITCTCGYHEIMAKTAKEGR